MKLRIQNLLTAPDSHHLLAEICTLSRRLDYHYIADVKRKKSEALFLKSFLSENFDGNAWVATEGGQVKGLTCLESLPWDSNILAYPALS